MLLWGAQLGPLKTFRGRIWEEEHEQTSKTQTPVMSWGPILNLPQWFPEECPKDVPKPANLILFGKREFVDEIKDSEVKRLSCAIQSHILREAKGDLASEKEGTFSATKARWCQAPALMEERSCGWKHILPLGLQVGASPRWPLHFCPPNHTCVWILLADFAVICYSSERKLVRISDPKDGLLTGGGGWGPSLVAAQLAAPQAVQAHFHQGREGDPAFSTSGAFKTRQNRSFKPTQCPKWRVWSLFKDHLVF